MPRWVPYAALLLLGVAGAGVIADYLHRGPAYVAVPPAVRPTPPAAVDEPALTGATEEVAAFQPPESSDPDLSWSGFRGPRTFGPTPATPPLVWSEKQNLAWKLPLPGAGHSSPVIKDGTIWLTTAEDDGRSLQVLGVAADTGRILHQREVFHCDQPQGLEKKNTHASPTPILAGDRLYVHFGSAGTACLDTGSGAVLWKTTALQVNHGGGPGASPLLCGNRLFIPFDGVDRQFLAALDCHTGRLAWKARRSRPPNGSAKFDAYSSPIAIEVDGAVQIVSAAIDRVCAYDPATGAELWHVDYVGISLVPQPIAGAGTVFICTGFGNPELWAIRPDGRGNVTDSHVLWKVKRNVPTVPTPLLVGRSIYMVNDQGIASCLDADTGKTHWRERLQGSFSASPVVLGDHVYFFNEAGTTYVLKPGPHYQLVSTNRLDQGCLATPAAAGPSLFVRTATTLYRVDNPAAQPVRAPDAP